MMTKQMMSASTLAATVLSAALLLAGAGKADEPGDGVLSRQDIPRACEGHKGQCHYSQRHCVVFWKRNGKEFMGGGTMPCGEAEAYVARMNQGDDGKSHWSREIWVNTLIDPAKDCMDPVKFHAPAPKADAAPAVKK